MGQAENPTNNPATSPLLNGKWKFLYASGAAPGLKALKVLLKSAEKFPKSPSGAELVEVGDTFLTIEERRFSARGGGQGGGGDRHRNETG